MNTTPSFKQTNTALLILRVVLGVIFIAHGAQKLFVFGLPGVTAGFTQMGIPMPGVTAPLVAIVEFSAGLAVLFGLLTRLAAVGLGVDMLGAIVLVHAKNGFFLPNGAEFALACFTIAASIVIAGPGAWSLDALIGKSRSASSAGQSGAARRAAA